MDLRPLSETLSVTQQLDPSDMAILAAQGVRTVIDNRPDAEIGAEQSSEAMRAAAEAAGLTFRYLPFAPDTGMTPDLLADFAEAMELPGPIVAYCRSGTRSANLWAISQKGLRSAEDIIAAGAAAGYDLSALAPYLR